MAGEGGFDLGSAYGHVDIDFANLDKHLNDVKNGLSSTFDQIGGMISSFGDQLAGLGKSLTVLTSPIAAFEVTGIKVAASFEDLMKQVELFGHLTGDELESARKLILKTGADTIFSGQQAGEAFLDMMKSGLSYAQAVETLPVVTDLAAAGNLSLAQSAGIVTSAMAQFGLSAKDARRAADTLVKGANASRASVLDLGQGMTVVGPVAHAMGLSFEDTNAALAVFANNGIMGSEAGTQLKSMLLNMTRPTDEVNAALEKLGVSLYNSDGSTRKFGDVILQLTDAMKKLPAKEQNELAYRLAGSYGITGLNALKAAAGIGDMNKAMAESPDAATVAGATAGTFNRLAESLGGSIEALQTQVLTPFMDNVLAPMVQQIITLVNQMTEWATKNPELANTIVMIVTAITALGPILFIVGTAISAIGAIIAALPLAAFVAGIVALGAAFATNFGGIQDVIMNAWAAIQPVLNLIYVWFVTQAMPQIVNIIQTQVIPALHGFFDYIGQVWAIIEPSLTKLVNWFITTGLPAILAFITTNVIPGIQIFFDLLKNVWDVVGPALLNLLDWFVNTGLPTVINFVQTQVMPIVSGFIDAIKTIWETVRPGLEDFAKWFTTDGIPHIQRIVQNLYDLTLKPLFDLLGRAWSLVQPALTAFGDWFKTTMPTIRDVVNWVLDAIKNLITWIDQGLSKFKDFTTSLSDTVSNIFGGGFNLGDLGGVFNNLFPKKDNGGPGVANQPYLIGKGAQPELFVPSTSGSFIPNFDQVLASLTGGGGNTDQSLNFAAGAIVINANSAAEGRAAADAFHVRLQDLIDRRG